MVARCIEVPHPERDEPLGWLVKDTLRNGLCFGGCRMTPTVTESEVAELARAMSWKLGCHGFPVGGAKAGIRVNPRSSEAPELLAHFARSIASELERDTVIGKDMGATDDLMDWIYTQAGIGQLDVVGVPGMNRLRELPGYVRHMTGRGVSYAVSAALGTRDLTGVRVAIQGAGLVGLGTAIRVEERGATVVAMSDKDRAIFWKDGIPAEQLVGMAGQTRDLSDVSGGEVRSTDTLFEADSDVLVLAAASYSVDESAVAGIRAPVVVEGANMAFTEEGRIAADSRSLVIVPDVIASSSSAAMVCIQMAERGRVPPDLLWNRIEEGIEEAWNTALSRSHSSGYSPREEHIRMCRT